MELPDVRSVEDIEALRVKAFEEIEETGAPGRAYYAWVEVLRRGGDDYLPSLAAAGGKIATVEESEAEMVRALRSSQRMPTFVPEHLRGVEIDGVPLAQLPVEYSLRRLAEMMVDAQPGMDRDAVSGLISDIESMVRADSWSTVEISEPEERLEVRVNSSSYESPDAYVAWRENASQEGNALGRLQIRSVGDGPLWSGITRFNAGDGGGEYQVAADSYLAAWESAAAGGEAEVDD